MLPGDEAHRSVGGDAIVVRLLAFGALDRLEAVGVDLRDIITQVPLAEICRLIAGFAEVGAHANELLRIQLGRVIRGHPGFVGIASGKDRIPGRHAQRIGTVGAGEDHAAGRQAVHRGRVEVARSHPATHGLGKLLVGHDEHHVGPCRRGIGRLQRKAADQGQPSRNAPVDEETQHGRRLADGPVGWK